MSPEHFDAVVVGSGFGGSVMAYRLAEAGRNVCLLERGRTYPPGSFARSPVEMRNNFWNPSEGQYGLFQIWRFNGIDGVVSAGLGGGSLIYANVFIRKDDSWFYRRDPDGSHVPWPITRADLNPHYDRVEQMMNLQEYPFGAQPYALTPKTRAMKESADALGLEWFTPKLAVTFGDPVDRPIPGEPIKGTDGSTTDNLHKRTRYTCRLCGECDVGCNYGSKNTLDYTYLTAANRFDNMTLRELCEVRDFQPLDGGGFSVRYVEHDLARAGRPYDTSTLPLVEITCDHLVLSAGTFGTAFLLQKNLSHFPALSPQLGRNFSGNGDTLGLILKARQDDGSPRVLAPSQGSVITSTIRVPDRSDGGNGPGYYLQDGGYPGFVDWLIEAANINGMLHRAIRFIGTEVDNWIQHEQGGDIDSALEGLIGDAHESSSVLPVLGMGLDTPDGQLSIGRDHLLNLTWSAASSEEYFNRVQGTMKDVAGKLNAKFQPDPVSYFHRKVITVHPVGGCAMGTSESDGVVNTHGEVFGYPGLVVSDGSVMPGPVGPNPSFTIAALADRFADRILRT